MRGEIKYDSRGTRSFFLDGREVTQEEFDRVFPAKPLGEPLPSHTPGCWPMISEAMAVHPSQIEQARERNRRHGLSVEYLADGRVVLADRGQRRDLMRIEGFHDNQGGYGD